MRQFFIVVCMVICSLAGQAQTGSQYALPVVGEFPQSNPRYATLSSGTPFFNEDWMQSRLIGFDGAVYNNVPIKLNLHNDKVHFRDEKGVEMVMKTPIRSIEFFAGANNRHITFVNEVGSVSGLKGWHQLLVGDSVSLLKTYRKTLEEHKSYGSATEYFIETKENYIAVFNSKMIEIKKPADLAQVLPAKKALIEQKATSLDKNLSKHDQLIMMVEFINKQL